MIHKIRQSLILLLLSTACFGQELPEEKTSNHVQIEGTNIFMVPPMSFENSANFKGFQNPNDPTSMIMVVDIPGPYAEVTKGFNAEMMKARGMDLKNKTDIRVAEYEGLLIELDQTSDGVTFSKRILIYGNEQSSTLINGVYLQDSTDLGEKIKASIVTTIVDSKLETNPRDFLKYSIDETVGGLQFHSVIGNGMLFNRDLKIPTESKDKATLITDQSYAKVEIRDQKMFCISRLKEYPESYTVISDSEIKEVEINELTGIELTAKSSENVEEEMYQVILFDQTGGYFLFVGTYLAGDEKALTDLKNIVRTFRKKE